MIGSVAHYDLTLFVSGATQLSGQAVAHASRICGADPSGDYRLAVVDVVSDPGAASTANVHAAPTLVRHLDTTDLRVVGDLSSAHAVRIALELPAPGDARPVDG